MDTIRITEAKAHLSEVIDKVQHQHERIVITRNGKEVAVVMPVSDVKLFEKLIEECEDREDAQDATRILKEIDDGAPTMTLEELKESLGF